MFRLIKKKTKKHFFLYLQCISAGDNACSVNYGGCTTLCLAIPGGRVCACADNQVLEKNNVTCAGRTLMNQMEQKASDHLLPVLQSYLGPEGQRSNRASLISRSCKSANKQMHAGGKWSQWTFLNQSYIPVITQSLGLWNIINLMCLLLKWCQ